MRSSVDSSDEIRSPPTSESLARSTLGGGIDGEHSAVVAYVALADDAFEQHSPCAGQERVDVVLVADVHEGVAMVRQAKASRGRRGQVEGKAVAVGNPPLGQGAEGLGAWLSTSSAPDAHPPPPNWKQIESELESRTQAQP